MGYFCVLDVVWSCVRIRKHDRGRAPLLSLSLSLSLSLARSLSLALPPPPPSRHSLGVDGGVNLLQQELFRALFTSPSQVTRNHFKYRSLSCFLDSGLKKNPDMERTRSCDSSHSAHSFGTTKRNVAFCSFHLCHGVGWPRK